MDEEFMTLVPAHRTYINYLINKGIIDTYAVSMESQTCWIIFNNRLKFFHIYIITDEANQVLCYP